MFNRSERDAEILLRARLVMLAAWFQAEGISESEAEEICDRMSLALNGIINVRLVDECPDGELS